MVLYLLIFSLLSAVSIEGQDRGDAKKKTQD